MRTSFRQLFSHRRYIGVALIFFVLSLLFSFWITYIPTVKQNLGLSEGELGLALFFLPMGLLFSMLVSGWLNQKWGEGVVTVWGIFLYGGLMPLPVIAPSFATLAGALFLTGFASGITDVAMNALASTLEKKHNVFIMAACHGFFSMGGMVGALIGGLVLSYVPISPFVHILGSAILLLLALWGSGILGELWPIRAVSTGEEKVFVFPKGALLGLSLLAFATMLGEGAVADWSGVYLRQLVQRDSGIIAMGYAAFSLMMTLGRLNGDQLIARLGKRIILIGGHTVGLLGIALLWSGHLWLAILGFACIGIGYSCVVPVVFSSAADTHETTAAAGIASVASVGYAGFLMGPVLIGFIAEQSSLSMAWGFVALLMLLSLGYAARAVH